MKAVQLKTMGTEVSAIDATASGQMYWTLPFTRWFESIDRLASRFRPDSELSAFNRAPLNTPIKLSPRLFGMLRSAWQWVERTEHYFQPFVGSDLCRLGYDKSFETLTGPSGPLGEPSVCRQSSAVSRDFSRALQLDDRTGSAVRAVDATIDLGGMGKGWSVDRASLLLRDSFHVTRGLIDAGGDMQVWSDGDSWPIGVQSPFDEAEEWLQLHIRDAAVATSNALYRRWVHDGQTHHHIVNGRTGQSAETDIVQATVLGPSVEEAEVAAKVICMIGSEQLAAWMRARFPHLGYIAITKSGSIRLNRNVYAYAEKVIA